LTWSRITEVEDLPLEDALLPEQAKAEGLAYLIEIQIARDVFENLRITAGEEPDAELRLRGVLHYREHDAYM
jgi:predicted glycosyltransferase